MAITVAHLLYIIQKQSSGDNFIQVHRKKMRADLQEMVLPGSTFSQMRPLQSGAAQRLHFLLTSYLLWTPNQSELRNNAEVFLNPPVFLASLRPFVVVQCSIYKV